MPDGEVIPLDQHRRSRSRGFGPDTGEPDTGEPGRGEADEGGAGPLIERMLAFVHRRARGEFVVDEYGFDAELTDTVLLELLRPVYRSWFRVSVRGVEHVPASGPALVVSNHAGTLPVDALMTLVAVHDEHPAHRHLRMLGADLIFRLPVVGDLARRLGTTLACPDDADRLLGAGEVVGVWPEGFSGIGKPFSQRYRLRRFGRGGFVATAVRAGAPIVPVAVVGSEEIYPMLTDLAPLARLLGLPYFPVTPTFPWLGPLGAIPLPSKWIIEFGAPVPTDDLTPSDADDPLVVGDLADQVRATVQQMLYRLVDERGLAFFGPSGNAAGPSRGATS